MHSETLTFDLHIDFVQIEREYTLEKALLLSKSIEKTRYEQNKIIEGLAEDINRHFKHE